MLIVEIAFDQPSGNWVELTINDQSFILSGVPCDPLSELIDAIVNALAYGSGVAEMDAEGETFRFEFSIDRLIATRVSHGDLMVDEPIQIQKLARKFLRAFELLRPKAEGVWSRGIPNLEPLRRLIGQKPGQDFPLHRF